MAVLLERITLFPIKSLDGVEVKVARLLPSGALADDRSLALFDLEGRVVNGKRTAKIHLVRSRFDLVRRRVSLSAAGFEASDFDLDGDRDRIADWFSNFFGFPVALRENLEHGFPDDLDSPGPTIISRQTLEQVCSWYEGIDLGAMRRRFRTNLELLADRPFWEDRLFLEQGSEVRFALGEVNFAGVNPCQRCPVPTRDAVTGEILPGFQKTFVAARERDLPSWVRRDRFNHFYRLAVNTRAVGHVGGKVLSVGDRLQIL
jgi:uncharacterized protein